MTRFYVQFWRLLMGFALLLPSANHCRAADLTLNVIDKEPPKEIGESIRQCLQSKAVQLRDGEKLVYEFWLRTEIPLRSKPESADKSLPAIAETTVLGVVSAQQDQRDYKDNEIAPGLYTMRFGLQPQDGDHLGTAEFPYFVVLIPVKTDTQLDGISGYKPMVKASSKGTATGHPVVLSLRPASEAGGNLPKLNEPVADQKSVRLSVPAKAAGQTEKTSVVFELVYFGKFKT